MTSFPPIGRGLHGATADWIGRAIVTGELPPGHRVDLDAISQRDDISRTVLREALRTVQAKGLLNARPNRGTHVAEPGDWHLLDPDVISWFPPEQRGDLEAFAAFLESHGKDLAENPFYAYTLRALRQQAPAQG